VATAKWATPSAVGSNIAGTTLDSLANAGTSAFVTHDNSSNLDLYASVRVTLGSIAAGAGASIKLHVHMVQDATAPNDTGSVGGGDIYSASLLVSTSIKEITFPMVRLYPGSLRLQITNNSTVTLASSGNEIRVRPYNESVS
jgi:hypothetical protein